MIINLRFNKYPIYYSEDWDTYAIYLNKVKYYLTKADIFCSTNFSLQRILSIRNITRFNSEYKVQENMTRNNYKPCNPQQKVIDCFDSIIKYHSENQL